MADSVFLAWKYVVFHRWKSATLVASLTCVMYVPAAFYVLVQQAEAELTSRATSTPMLVGARGSATDLVLNLLYFDTDSPPTVTMAEWHRIVESGYAEGVPLHTRFRARDFPVVGTTLDYFNMRRFRIARGQPFTRLGDCVLGSRVARALSLTPGDTLVSDAENPFDFAGAYPLELRVVGVLRATGSSDDEAIFVDLKTTWVMAGLGHGHRDLADEDADGDVLLESDDDSVTANESIETFTVITNDNLRSFHFHGDPATFPVHGVLVVPHDERSATLLEGRYLDRNSAAQIVRPAVVMQDLLDAILAIHAIVLAASGIVSVGTLFAIAAIFVLSIRMRRVEMNTMFHLGCSRVMTASLLVAEGAIVLALSTASAAILVVMTQRFGAEWLWRLAA